MILSGESAAKWSGVLRDGTFCLGNHPLKVVVITVRTTTFVSKIWNKGYHGSVGASRWFCRIYYGKAIIVGLVVGILTWNTFWNFENVNRINGKARLHRWQSHRHPWQCLRLWDSRAAHPGAGCTMLRFLPGGDLQQPVYSRCHPQRHSAEIASIN